MASLRMKRVQVEVNFKDKQRLLIFSMISKGFSSLRPASWLRSGIAKMFAHIVQGLHSLIAQNGMNSFAFGKLKDHTQIL